MKHEVIIGTDMRGWGMGWLEWHDRHDRDIGLQSAQGMVDILDVQETVVQEDRNYRQGYRAARKEEFLRRKRGQTEERFWHL